MNHTEGRPNKAVIALIVIVLVGLVVAGVYYVTTQNQPSEQNNAGNQSQTDTTQPQNESTQTGSYTDGTYTATGGYTSPGGSEEVKVELALSGGTVRSLTVTPLTTHPTSKQYQTSFAGGAPSLVIGKSIDEVQLDVVAGSSLTSAGFNKAIEQIKSDATRA